MLSNAIRVVASSFDVKSFKTLSGNVKLFSFNLASDVGIASHKVRLGTHSNLRMNLIYLRPIVERQETGDFAITSVDRRRNTVIARSLRGIDFGERILVDGSDSGCAKGDYA